MGKKRRYQSNSADPKKPRTDDFKKIITECPLFEAFYQGQNIVSSEEWPEFMATLRKNLPSSFRISEASKGAQDLKKVIDEKYVKELENIEIEGEIVEPPIPISYYPNQMAYQYSASRQQIRRCDVLGKFHSFLVAETEIGNISRQETVSMIPPLFLDIEPHHVVLDMCAAPGSKTAQILEAIHSDLKSEEIPTGVVIANDADNKRAYTLTHQAKRLASPCLIVTNHDASIFPNIMINEENGASTRLAYDRILADVPCSGDGTIRKNPLIWQKWSPNNAIGLHKLQCLILERAIQLLKPGGRVVYSTCAFNPMENEAVIAQVLRQYSDSVKLVDVSDHLPDLKRDSGMNSWRVMTKKGEWIDSYDKLPEHIKAITPSMFPPTAEEVEKFNLNRCMRILPHHQNTGGFFVAVLEKCKAESAVEEQAMIDKMNEFNSKREFSGHQEEPFIFLSSTADAVQETRKHYGLSENLPMDQFLVRSDKQRCLYFVSETVKKVLEATNIQQIKVVNAGVRAFGRGQVTEAPNATETPAYCPFRLCHEILPTLFPHLHESRIIQVSFRDMLTALTKTFPFFSDFSTPVQERLQSSTYGGCVFHCQPTSEEMQHPPEGVHFIPHSPIMISVWRGRVSVNTMLNNKERRSLLMLMMGVDQADAAMLHLKHVPDHLLSTSTKSNNNTNEQENQEPVEPVVDTADH